MNSSAAVVREHWHDRRQEHSCGKRSSNTDPACDSCSLSLEMAFARDVGLEVTVWPENQSSEVRQTAAEALGELGEHAASAVPVLTKYLEHENGDVRRGGW